MIREDLIRGQMKEFSDLIIPRHPSFAFEPTHHYSGFTRGDKKEILYSTRFVRWNDVEGIAVDMYPHTAHFHALPFRAPSVVTDEYATAANEGAGLIGHIRRSLLPELVRPVTDKQNDLDLNTGQVVDCRVRYHALHGEYEAEPGIIFVPGGIGSVLAENIDSDFYFSDEITNVSPHTVFEKMIYLYNSTMRDFGLPKHLVGNGHVDIIN